MKTSIPRPCELSSLLLLLLSQMLQLLSDLIGRRHKIGHVLLVVELVCLEDVTRLLLVEHGVKPGHVELVELVCHSTVG